MLSPDTIPHVKPFNENSIEVDIIIFGGGIAGLWALNRLRAKGYSTLLFESNALGSGQTIKSQGIIHGGIKYALQGKLTDSSNAVETMPQRWKECLEGRGEIDLRSVSILSPDQLLWSTGSLASEISGFFASKALTSRVKTLDKQHYPSVLQNPKFKGHVYRLEEVVLDTPSLIQTLIQPHIPFVFKVDPSELEWVFEENNAPENSSQKNKPHNIHSLKLKTLNLNSSSSNSSHPLIFKAKHFLVTAGEGNESLTSKLNLSFPMQRRPLHMVLIKFPTPHPFFAHCIDFGSTPRITITSHQTKNGEGIWYLGGKIAEDGIHRTEQEQINFAKKEIITLFPWLDLTQTEWKSFFINRAEAKQPNKKRPDSFFLETRQNVTVAWPTKLALAPLLVDAFLNKLNALEVHPRLKTSNLAIHQNNGTVDTEVNMEILSKLNPPKVATPVWDELFY